MLGWTQNDLASRSGVAKRSIAGLELETSRPKAETLARLVSTLAAEGIEFCNVDADQSGISLRRTKVLDGAPAQPGMDRMGVVADDDE